MCQCIYQEQRIPNQPASFKTHSFAFSQKSRTWNTEDRTRELEGALDVLSWVIINISKSRQKYLKLKDWHLPVSFQPNIGACLLWLDSWDDLRALGDPAGNIYSWHLFPMFFAYTPRNFPTTTTIKQHCRIGKGSLEYKGITYISLPVQ